eukprot:7935460-Prorocentrum_lima.AAC.1
MASQSSIMILTNKKIRGRITILGDGNQVDGKTNHPSNGRTGNIKNMPGGHQVTTQQGPQGACQ